MHLKQKKIKTNILKAGHCKILKRVFILGIQFKHFNLFSLTKIVLATNTVPNALKNKTGLSVRQRCPLFFSALLSYEKEEVTQ